MIKQDWTRAMAHRRTEWLWASFCGYTKEGKKLGVNLSRRLYDSMEGVSMENALWIDGKMILLDKSVIDFDLPSETDAVVMRQEEWHIRTQKAGKDPVLDLHFQPKGSRDENVHLLSLVVSEFVQPFGLFHGTIHLPQSDETLHIDGILGVVEHHVSVW